MSAAPGLPSTQQHPAPRQVSPPASRHYDNLPSWRLVGAVAASLGSVGPFMFHVNGRLYFAMNLSLVLCMDFCMYDIG